CAPRGLLHLRGRSASPALKQVLKMNFCPYDLRLYRTDSYTIPDESFLISCWSVPFGALLGTTTNPRQQPSHGDAENKVRLHGSRSGFARLSELSALQIP